MNAPSRLETPRDAGAPSVPLAERWKTQLEIGSVRTAATDPWLVTGRITRATGLVLHATGLRLPVGAACRIERHLSVSAAGPRSRAPGTDRRCRGVTARPASTPRRAR